jgi:peptidoglycan/xylan/chitin deacetylase (PgdA/CDA1 family)
VKNGLKHFAEAALVGSGLNHFSLKRFRDRTLVLAYHNVLPNGEKKCGDSSLHLRQRDFAQQLDVLAESHDVISIGELARNDASLTGRARAVITFDDAYAGALTVGVRELVTRALPATFFVAPALLRCTPWWDTLASPDTGDVPESVRTNALERLDGKTELVLGFARSKTPVPTSNSKLPQIGSEEDLARAASEPGITIASHTWSHPNLCKLSEPELDDELRRPREWIRSRYSSTVPWLSYPYGLHNEQVQRAAKRAGYVGAFRIEGGWIARSSANLYSLPRLNIPAGLSLEGFRLRISGL